MYNPAMQCFNELCFAITMTVTYQRYVVKYAELSIAEGPAMDDPRFQSEFMLSIRELSDVIAKARG
jgi:hypothetical protein